MHKILSLTVMLLVSALWLQAQEGHPGADILECTLGLRHEVKGVVAVR